MEKLVTPDRALELVLAEAPAPHPERLSVVATLGLVAAEEVSADRDYPPYPRASMDGFAVRCADAGFTVAIAGMVAAGAEPVVTVEPGHVVEIMTGACCPEGTEAVVPYEDCTRDRARVTLPGTIRPGANIARVGSECSRGRTVIPAGSVISPLGLAACAAFGWEHLSVLRPPRIGMISTGQELVPADIEPSPLQIRDSNSPLLRAMAAAMGVTDFVSRLVADDAGALAEALESMRNREILLLSGGVSAGVWDLVPDALRAWGADIVFHKVTQQPGKPLLFARRGDLWIFALPGNPLACHLGFHRYVAPVIRRFMGLAAETQIRRARLESPLVCKGKRTFFQLAHLAKRDGEAVVTPISGAGSADLFSPAAKANAYLRLEPGSVMPAGAIVTCELLEGSPWRN